MATVIGTALHCCDATTLLLKDCPGFLPEASEGSPAADYCWPTDGWTDQRKDGRTGEEAS